jgi:hypothetical protein
MERCVVVDVEENDFSPDLVMAVGEKAFTVAKERKAAERMRMVVTVQGVVETDSTVQK